MEKIWVEIKLSSGRIVLYGVFYRPPNADSVYISLIEDSISLAVDTGIPDIIIMGVLIGILYRISLTVKLKRYATNLF